MHIIWEKGSCLVHDVLEALPEPRPAYNTVSTIVRILEKKGFVGHKAYGKTHSYYPLVEKEAYTRGFLNRFVENYFQNSYGSLVSFFARNRSLSVGEMEAIRRLMDDEIKKAES